MGSSNAPRGLARLSLALARCERRTLPGQQRNTPPHHPLDNVVTPHEYSTQHRVAYAPRCRRGGGGRAYSCVASPLLFHSPRPAPTEDVNWKREST